MKKNIIGISVCVIAVVICLIEVIFVGVRNDKRNTPSDYDIARFSAVENGYMLPDDDIEIVIDGTGYNENYGGETISYHLSSGPMRSHYITINKNIYLHSMEITEK